MSHHAKKLSTMSWILMMWSAPTLLASGVVTYIDCDVDADPISCSPEEIADGGQIDIAGYLFRENSGGFYIGSAFNDGDDFPDYHLPKVTAELGPHRITIIHDDQQQIRANNLHAGGNTVSFVNFHFDLDIPPDETIYAFSLGLTPAVLTGSCALLQTTFELSTEELELDLASTNPDGTRLIEIVLPTPLEGGATGTTAGADLYLRADITGCGPLDEGFEVAHHGTVFVRLLRSPPTIFADGFESGDLTVWSSATP